MSSPALAFASTALHKQQKKTSMADIERQGSGVEHPVSHAPIDYELVRISIRARDERMIDPQRHL
jgi:hypothetical protein